MRSVIHALLFSTIACCPAAARADVEPKPRIDDDGFRRHRVMSEYQAGATEIKVLLPERMEKGKRYPVIYVLPVEAQNGKKFVAWLITSK